MLQYCPMRRRSTLSGGIKRPKKERKYNMAQLWGGRFTRETDEAVYRFNASIAFDKRLYRQDICGSIAHVKMLAEQGILTGDERDLILEGLEGIFRDVESKSLEITEQ